MGRKPLSPKEKKNLLDALNRALGIAEGRGISQADLAGRIDVTPQTVSDWKSEKVGFSAKRLTDIALALGVSVEHLKGEGERLTEAQSELAIRLADDIAKWTEELQALLTHQRRVLSDAAYAQERYDTLRKRLDESTP